MEYIDEIEEKCVERTLRSLRDATVLTVAYKGVMLTGIGLNSPYKSHRMIEFGIPCGELEPNDFLTSFYCDEFFLFNGKYEMHINETPEKNRGIADGYEWIDVCIPVNVVKAIVERLPGYEMLNIEWGDIPLIRVQIPFKFKK